MFRVTELRDKSLLLDVHLAPDWENERLFQTLRLWERPGSSGPTAYTAFQSQSLSGPGWIDLSQSTSLLADGSNVEWSDATMVKAEGSHIRVNGKAKSRYLYLVQFKKLAITKGALLVARGRLERGGLAVGIIKDDKWYRQVVIDQPGEFVAAVEVDQAGVFVPMITNAIESAWDTRNRFVVTDFGILDPKDSRMTDAAFPGRMGRFSPF